MTLTHVHRALVFGSSALVLGILVGCDKGDSGGGQNIEKARSLSMNNLRMIGIALHSHHDALGKLPAAAITDEKGKPFLSWRVSLLQYLEQNSLFRQFNFDEPWDGPNNIKLLDKMPSVFAAPKGISTAGPTETHYRVFVTKSDATLKTPFFLSEPKGGRGSQPTSGFYSFKDGVPNTLLVVEAAKAVPWTKPDELEYDPAKPIPELATFWDGGFLGVMGDGLARKFKKGIPEKTLRDLITLDDGNKIDWTLID